MTVQTRRRLTTSFAALVAASPAFAATSVVVSNALPRPADPDASLLSLRAELDAAAAEAGHWNMVDDYPEEDLNRSALRLSEACWAIVDMPRANTPAGWALKAAASMHQFRFSYGCGGWGSEGEEMAWNVLRELAGDSYQGIATLNYARSGVPS